MSGRLVAVVAGLGSGSAELVDPNEQPGPRSKVMIRPHGRDRMGACDPLRMTTPGDRGLDIPSTSIAKPASTEFAHRDGPLRALTAPALMGATTGLVQVPVGCEE
jgi:hypothetical protein